MLRGDHKLWLPPKFRFMASIVTDIGHLSKNTQISKKLVKMYKILSIEILLGKENIKYNIYSLSGKVNILRTSSRETSETPIVT